MCGPFGWNMGVAMFPMMLLCLVMMGAFVGAMSWLARAACGRNGWRGQTPLDILNSRYVRGEITRDEYEQMRDDLTWG